MENNGKTPIACSSCAKAKAKCDKKVSTLREHICEVATDLVPSLLAYFRCALTQPGWIELWIRSPAPVSVYRGLQAMMIEKQNIFPLR